MALIHILTLASFIVAADSVAADVAGGKGVLMRREGAAAAAEHSAGELSLGDMEHELKTWQDGKEHDGEEENHDEVLVRQLSLTELPDDGDDLAEIEESKVPIVGQSKARRSGKGGGSPPRRRRR